jgi:hypothetical protein
MREEANLKTQMNERVKRREVNLREVVEASSKTCALSELGRGSTFRFTIP